MSKLLALLTLFAASATAFASCQNKGGEPLFSCTMENGKHLEICGLYDGGIEYSFGRSLAEPEMNFRLAQRDSYYEFVLGPYWVNKTLYMPLGNVVYILFTRFSTKEEDTNELIVMIDGEQRAVLNCKPTSVSDNLDEDTLFSASREMTLQDPSYDAY